MANVFGLARCCAPRVVSRSRAHHDFQQIEHHAGMARDQARRTPSRPDAQEFGIAQRHQSRRMRIRRSAATFRQPFRRREWWRRAALGHVTLHENPQGTSDDEEHRPVIFAVAGELRSRRANRTSQRRPTGGERLISDLFQYAEILQPLQKSGRKNPGSPPENSGARSSIRYFVQSWGPQTSP